MNLIHDPTPTTFLEDLLIGIISETIVLAPDDVGDDYEAPEVAFVGENQLHVRMGTADLLVTVREL